MNLEKEDIDNELFGKTNKGFVVPEGYFEELEERILSKTSDNGFIVPKNYFETLENRIQNKISANKIIKYDFAFKQLVIGAAASIIFVSGFFLLKNDLYSFSSKTGFTENKLNKTNREQVINYLDLDDSDDIQNTISTSKSNTKTVEAIILDETFDQDILEQL